MGGCLRLWQNDEKTGRGGVSFCLRWQPRGNRQPKTLAVTGVEPVEQTGGACLASAWQGVSRWPGVVSRQGRAVAWRGHAERELRAQGSSV